MPLVAITDYSFDDLALEESILRPAGCDIVAWKERRAPEDLARLVADADAVITQFATVNAEVIRAMRRSRAIVRYGIGVDNVDLAAAREAGILVCNVPDYCIDEVADQTLAFILAMTRQVCANSQLVHDGRWGLAVPLSGMQALRDLTVGIVGYGRIGREVAARLRPFKCRMLVSDPVVDASELANAGCQSAKLHTLLAESDIVTLHCPSTDGTRGMINAQSLAGMKRGAILVNVARGDLVDSAALVQALDDGKLAGAALDVFVPEPIPADHPILQSGRVVLASHIASTSVRAVRTLRETAARLALAAVRGEKLANIVNGVTPAVGK
ncbi:MAG: C-terminal binding protein [Pirellulales bacterium]|nr:C-terminal binding protein [Pirellulales bacterium]